MVKVKLNVLLQTVINNRELQRQHHLSSRTPVPSPINYGCSCDSLMNVATQFHEILLESDFHLENSSRKSIEMFANHSDEIKFS